MDPTKFLKDPNVVVLPKLPGKIHVREGDKFKIAEELVRWKICDWIPFISSIRSKWGKDPEWVIWSWQTGYPGFGRTGAAPNNEPHWNQLHSGTVGRRMLEFAQIPGWQSVVIDNNEAVELFQSDMSSALTCFDFLELGWDIYPLILVLMVQQLVAVRGWFMLSAVQSSRWDGSTL